MARSCASTSSSRRLAGFAASAVAALGLAGCVIVPMPPTPARDIPPVQREALRAGQATRADILMRYGEPDLRLEGDRVLVYRWNRMRAALVIFAQGMATFPIDDVEACFLEFDGFGKLSRIGMAVAWEKKTIDQQAADWARGDALPPATQPPRTR